MDKIDTQGMSIPSFSSKNAPRENFPPMEVKKRTVFSELEREEIKEIIFEALDEYGFTRNH